MPPMVDITGKRFGKLIAKNPIQGVRDVQMESSL